MAYYSAFSFDVLRLILKYRAILQTNYENKHHNSRLYLHKIHERQSALLAIIIFGGSPFKAPFPRCLKEELLYKNGIGLF
jgi:hypothetical protein